MYTLHFCIICLTETWLSDFICDSEILPAGFVLYRKLLGSVKCAVCEQNNIVEGKDQAIFSSVKKTVRGGSTDISLDCRWSTSKP